MALPLFFSVIALVVVSTTALIIVRNRVRIRNVSESSRRNKYQSEVRSARQNATISALVNEINVNTEEVNDFAKKTDGRLTNLSKTNKTRVDNIDKRLNSYHNLTTANFMGMNNRVDKEVARLDAVDDILRDNIAQERRERIAEDTKLDNLITQNRVNHSTFVNSNYIPFVAQTKIDFENAYSNMNRIETEYKNSDDRLSTNMAANKRDVLSRIDTVNTDLGERIAAVQSSLDSAIFDSIEADSNQLDILQDSINGRSQHINNSLNTFFDHDSELFSPEYSTSRSFDDWAQDKYYSSLLQGNTTRTFLNLQNTIDIVEEHSRQLNSTGQRLDDFDTYNETNRSNILSLQQTDSNLEALVRTEADDIRSNLLIKEDRINALDSNLKSKAEASNLSNLNQDFETLKIDTRDSLDTIRTQAYSNLPTQIRQLRSNFERNDTGIYRMGGVLEEHDQRIALLEASGGSNSNGPAPITLTPISNSNWNPAWRPNVENITTNVLEANYSNQKGLLMSDTDFTDHILVTAENHSNIAKVDDLDTIFNTRILPTIKANNFEGSNATITNITGSNITINGTLDATAISTTGDLTIGGDLIMTSSNEEAVPTSFSGLQQSLQTVQGTANTVSSKFDTIFNVNIASPGFAVWTPEIDTNSISNIDIQTNVNIGSATNPKNLRLYQNIDGNGGEIIVPSFEKIKKVEVIGGVNTYPSLADELRAAASGASPSQLATQLSNQRIIDLKTGLCDVDGINPGCRTIGYRLDTLETTVDEINSAIESSPSEGGGGITLGYPQNPDFASINVTDNATIGGDATIDEDAAIGRNATIGGDATIGGNATISGDTTISGPLTVQPAVNKNMTVTNTALELTNLPLMLDRQNVGTTLSTIDTRVSTLESTNHPVKYVTDISVSGSNLAVTYEGTSAPSPNTTTVNLPSPSPEIDLTGWKINEASYAGGTPNSHGYTKLELTNTTESSKDLYLPDKSVTDISYNSSSKELNFMYQYGGNRNTETIDLSSLEPPTDFSRGIKIGGIILKPDPAGEHMQICRGGEVGTATLCTPLWDHEQAPDPSSTPTPTPTAVAAT